MEQALSNLAAAMVKKYPAVSVQSMGATILFGNDRFRAVADVRKWIEQTKFVKQGVRVYSMVSNGYTITGVIENQTYGVWAIQLEAQKEVVS